MTSGGVRSSRVRTTVPISHPTSVQLIEWYLVHRGLARWLEGDMGLKGMQANLAYLILIYPGWLSAWHWGGNVLALSWEPEMATVGQTKGPSHLWSSFQWQPAADAGFGEEWGICRAIVLLLHPPASCWSGASWAAGYFPAPCLAAPDGLFTINFSNLFLNQYLFLASSVYCDECHGLVMCCVRNVCLFLF